SHTCHRPPPGAALIFARFRASHQPAMPRTPPFLRPGPSGPTPRLDETPSPHPPSLRTNVSPSPAFHPPAPIEGAFAPPTAGSGFKHPVTPRPFQSPLALATSAKSLTLPRMPDLVVTLNIGPEKVAAYYRGETRAVVVRATNGQTVQFPMSVLHKSISTD